MTKGKSKMQKRKFFGAKRNRGVKFEKKEKDPSQPADGNFVRKRGFFSWISTAGLPSVPHCSHGPCLLFAVREKGVIVSRHFACAIYRPDSGKCPFKAECDESGKVLEVEGEPIGDDPTPPAEYGKIPNKLATLPDDCTIVYCPECFDVFANRHACPCEVKTREELGAPSRFLEALDVQHGEAQFWFSEESVDVLCAAADKSGADGILCVGSPRGFETLRASGKADRKCFMLDYDRRFAPYHHPSEFQQYSMLVDHFYEEEGRAQLTRFLSTRKHVLLVCDPPFGVYTDPLMETMHKLKKMHVEARKGKQAEFSSMIVLPLFVGKHILKSEGDKWSMMDYRVTYTNHKVFSQPGKTTVRVFTDLPAKYFDLDGIAGYKYCDMCEEWVWEENKHCFMCQKCTSKDGSPYKHCARCMRCYKATYKHCSECGRCHLPVKGRCREEARRLQEQTEKEENQLRAREEKEEQGRDKVEQWMDKDVEQLIAEETLPEISELKNRTEKRKKGEEENGGEKKKLKKKKVVKQEEEEEELPKKKKKKLHHGEDGVSKKSKKAVCGKKSGRKSCE